MLTVSLATLAETDVVVGILKDAVQFLRSRNLPTWNPDTLPAIMGAAVPRVVRRVIPQQLQLVRDEGADFYGHLTELVWEVTQVLHGFE